MKDPYSKFDQCIFCENSADSKEHIISKWIGKQLRPRDNARAPRRKRLADGSEEVIELKASSPITGFTSQSVCISCNTGWMHDIVDDAKPILEKLITGNFRGVLEVADQLKLYRHFAIMGMVVDVETKYSDPALTQMQRVGFAGAKCPSPLLAVHAGKYHLHANNPYFNVAYAKMTVGRRVFHIKTVSVVLGSLAIAIDVGAEHRPKPMGYRKIEARARIKWPPIKLLDENRIMRLEYRDVAGRRIVPTL